MQFRVALGGLLSALLVAAYALASYYAATHAGQEPWALAIALGPLVLALLLATRKLLGMAGLVIVTLILALLIYRFYGSLQSHVPTTYYLQHLGMMLCGAACFGLSLIGPSVPLCTRFAQYSHAMTAELERYTRRVTIAWTLFFIVMAAVSTVLFVSPLSFSVWAAFDTLFTLPLVALMFAAEYAVRRLVLPHAANQGITSAYRAYQAYRADHGHPVHPAGGLKK